MRQRILTFLERRLHSSHSHHMEATGIPYQAKKRQTSRSVSSLQLGMAQFNIILSPIALISVVTRCHPAIGLQTCSAQQPPTPSHRHSQTAGQAAFPSIARAASPVLRGSLAPSGQAGLQGAPQCNGKSSKTRSTSRP